MKTNELADLEVSDKAMKRAQWESMTFDVPSSGLVVVRNESYGAAEADDHSHAVMIEDGVPVACGCPADEHQPGACKHRVAVALAEPVLGAASVSRSIEPVRADGGVVLSPETRGESLENTVSDASSHADGCDNPECEGYDVDGRPLLSFECWAVWTAPEGGR